MAASSMASAMAPSRLRFESRIAVDVAGLLAEEVIFGSVRGESGVDLPTAFARCGVLRPEEALDDEPSVVLIRGVVREVRGWMLEEAPAVLALAKMLMVSRELDDETARLIVESDVGKVYPPALYGRVDRGEIDRTYAAAQAFRNKQREMTRLVAIAQGLIDSVQTASPMPAPAETP